MEDVFFGVSSSVEYASHKDYYSPSVAYPEYPFENISEIKNEVYQIIRDGLRYLDLDGENYGTERWNPLGSFIQKGSTVVLKPNWVFHENNEPEKGDMQCMVTNASIIRAVLDYVHIALKDSGKIIVADAPIQLCNYNELQKNANYNELWEFYKQNHVDVEVLDLRGLITEYHTDHSLKVVNDTDDGIVVNLGDCSYFNDVDAERIKQVRITNYDPDILIKHHNIEKHEYLIHPVILKADVIINLPKPKSHRKAGMTACAKNYVGACQRKEYLPHHCKGSVKSGGDEYNRHTFLRTLSAWFVDMKNRTAYRNGKSTRIYYLLGIVCDYFGRKIMQDNTQEGSWYGNDTIWRTIMDLNTIIRYADKIGKICDSPQRKLFNICDMIIVGEKEGPMLPSPKKLGMIVMGESGAAVDYLICKIFRFDPQKVKNIMPMLELDRIYSPQDEIIIHTDCIVNALADFEFIKDWGIQPSEGWKHYLEECNGS